MTAVLHAFADEAAPAQRLADAADLRLDLIQPHIFPDGENLPVVAPPAPIAIVYRSLDRPNAKLIELLLTADALRRNGAHRLVLVVPYLPYMRQDKMFHAGEPISQRVIAGLLDTSFDRIVTVDPHLHRTGSLEDLFHMAACTHLHAAEALVPFLRRLGVDDKLVVVGPDSESAPWVERVARPVGAESMVLTKDRRDDRSVEVWLPANADLAGRKVLLVDDICSTGGTLSQAARKLRTAGAEAVTIYVTHALFGADVLEQLHRAGADRVISSDSCLHSTNAVQLAPLLASALRSEVEAPSK